MLRYIEIEPPVELKRWIANYWKFEVEASDDQSGILHEILPEQFASLVFINHPLYKGIRVIGPQTRKYQQEVYSNSVFLGIRFHPWIDAESIFGDRSSMLNLTKEAPAFVSNFFTGLSIEDIKPGFSDYQYLTLGLTRLFAEVTTQEDLLVKYICIKLHDSPRINELSKEVPLSIRPLQKRFKKITGVTMQEYRNIIRLQKTVKLIYLERKGNMECIFTSGYYDQAHFINDFKKAMQRPLKVFLSYLDRIDLSM